MSAVVITQNDSIEHAIAEALEHIPLERLVKNILVAVKPNETWASAEDSTGVTQPDTLRAVLREIRQFKPRELIVSGGYTYTSNTDYMGGQYRDLADGDWTYDFATNAWTGAEPSCCACSRSPRPTTNAPASHASETSPATVASSSP